MKIKRRVKYYLYINNMSMTVMNSINEVGRKSLSIANKIIAVGGKIKLSISRVSIKVANTINEFIHPSRYENKIIFNAKSSFLKSKDVIISNKEKTEYNLKDNERITLSDNLNINNNEKIVLKERQQFLKDIELPNGDLIPIDKAINAIHLCKQDSILKSKLSLIDHIADMQFKSPMKNSIELSNKFNDNLIMADSKNKYEYVKLGGYENNLNYKNEKINISNLKYSDNSINDGYLIMTNLKNSDKNTINEVKSNANEIKSFSEKEDFKSYLTEITKDISLLDRLSDGDNSYGYVFLAKVANYLEDYNKNKEQEKTDCFNKENYLKKLANSDCFFKLNKKVNNVIYLQYLKKEQSNDEYGSVAEKVTVTANNILNEGEKLKEAERQKEVFSAHDKLNENNMSKMEKQHKDGLSLMNNDDSFKDFLDEIDNQLSISNENKNLTLDELLKKVKK